MRRLELAVVLLGLLRRPLVTRRVALGRVGGLLPGRFLRATRRALVLAGIIRRLPRLVFRAVLLPVARTRVLVWPFILAVCHLMTFPA